MALIGYPSGVETAREETGAPMLDPGMTLGMGIRRVVCPVGCPEGRREVGMMLMGYPPGVEMEPMTLEPGMLLGMGIKRVVGDAHPDEFFPPVG